MNEDKVIEMLLDHESRLERIEENMATKADLRQVIETQDEVLKFVKKIDTEMSAIVAHNKRVDSEFFELKQKVASLK